MHTRRDLTKQTIAFFWSHAWKYPKYVVSICVAIPFTVLVSQIIPPIILARVLYRLSNGDFQPHHLWASFGVELVGYGLLVMIGPAVLWRIVDIFTWRMEGNALRDIAQQVFDHLLDQSANFHANHFGGSLVSQTNKLMGGYIRTADTTIFNVAPLLLGLLFSSIILLYLAPLFAVILLLFASAYIVSAFFVTRRVRRLGAIHAEVESTQTGYLADAITNIMAIKSFAGARFEEKRFASATSNTRASLFEMSRAHQKQQAFFGISSGLISGASLTMAVIGVMVFHANVATVFLIFSYTATIVGQLFQFSNNGLRNYNRAFGDSSTMVEILSQAAEINDPSDPETAHFASGAIRFNNVAFQHDGSDDAIFNDLSLKIQPGEKVGLVGHSGSGKTTLTRILLRFSDIDSGTITIDGQNIAAVTQDDLRRHIAYVPQEPLLFHRSIAENIRYGQPEASQQEVVAIAKQASADEFVRLLPHGYDTLVGERGVKLSGGQRQRIAIARAMLKNAPILVLDEATSALDSESEVLIQSALWKLMEGRTAIVIAHRLSTIQKMDRIIVLDNGVIVEEGSHKELVGKKAGTYAKLWAHQSGGFIED